ncbi:MAG: GNAT family N-acetyltransferase [Bacillota bacterium]
MIQGNHTKLRPICRGDWDQILCWDQDNEIARWFGKPEWDRIGRHQLSMMYAIESLDGQLIGYIGLEHISWRQKTAELRVCIGKSEFRGKGYGSDAIRTFLNHTFKNSELDQIYLRVYTENVRAIKCYLKCGFRKEAVLYAGKRRSEDFRDMVLMTIRRAV